MDSLLGRTPGGSELTMDIERRLFRIAQRLDGFSRTAKKKAKPDEGPLIERMNTALKPVICRFLCDVADKLAEELDGKWVWKGVPLDVSVEKPEIEDDEGEIKIRLSAEGYDDLGEVEIEFDEDGVEVELEVGDKEVKFSGGADMAVGAVVEGFMELFVPASSGLGLMEKDAWEKSRYHERNIAKGRF